jgi:two-component system response regulator
MTDERSPQPIAVLLVEDDPADAELLRRAFVRSQIEVQLDHVTTGQDALAFLRNEGRFADSEPPDIVLLDLQLGPQSGHDVLSRIKEDPALKRIPVIVLTSTDDVDEIKKTYQLFANSFVTKPRAFDDYLKLVQALAHFWSGTVRLPPKRRG